MIRPVRHFDDVDAYGSLKAPFLDGEDLFTGLAVEVGQSGGLAEITEVRDGFEHGYSLELQETAIPGYVEEMRRGLKHGLVATWKIDGSIESAERYEYDFPTEKLQIDPAGGEPSVVAVDENAEDIERMRGQLMNDLPPMEKSVVDLLVAFDIYHGALIEEARRGLALPAKE